MNPVKFYLLQFVHNCFLHPLLGLCGWPPAWLLRLHDWSARLTWPGLEAGIPPGGPERYDHDLAD